MDKELIFKASLLQQQSDQIEQKLNLISQQLHELQHFNAELEELSKNRSKEILSSLGKGIFLKTNVSEEKLFVDVGSGVLVRKNFEETKKLIEDQTLKLNQLAEESTKDLQKVNGELSELMSKLESSK